MPDDIHNQHIDESLAEFTDRVIRQAKITRKDPNEPDLLNENLELARLQQTVLQLQRAVPDQQPSRPFLARLHQSLLAEYRRIPAEAQPGRPTWMRQLIDLFRVPQHGLTLRLALVAVAVLAMTLFFYPTLNPALPAAAGMSEYQSWLVLALGAVCVALVIWLVREKK